VICGAWTELLQQKKLEKRQQSSEIDRLEKYSWLPKQKMQIESHF